MLVTRSPDSAGLNSVEKTELLLVDLDIMVPVQVRAFWTRRRSKPEPDSRVYFLFRCIVSLGYGL